MTRPGGSLPQSFPSWGPKPRQVTSHMDCLSGCTTLFARDRSLKNVNANSGENAAFMNVNLYLSLPESGWLKFAGDVCFLCLFIRSQSGQSGVAERRTCRINLHWWSRWEYAFPFRLAWCSGGGPCLRIESLGPQSRNKRRSHFANPFPTGALNPGRSLRTWIAFLAAQRFSREIGN